MHSIMYLCLLKSLPLKLIEKMLQIAVVLTSFNLINSGANANLANDLPNWLHDKNAIFEIWVQKVSLACQNISHRTIFRLYSFHILHFYGGPNRKFHTDVSNTFWIKYS